MIKIRKYYFIYLLLLVLIPPMGCNTAKKTLGHKGKDAFEGVKWTSAKILEAMKEQNVDFETLSARLHVDYKGGNEQYNNVATYIRMKKDSAIWLSIRPVFGIEMLRILVTPDSIKLRNNLKNKQVTKSAKDISEILHIPVDFSILQALIMGNPTTIPTRIKHFEADSLYINLSLSEGPFLSQYQWSKKDFLLKKSHYQMGQSEQYATQYFEDYQHFSVGEVSKERNIIIKDSDQKEIHLTFDKLIFNEPVSFPF